MKASEGKGDGYVGYAPHPSFSPSPPMGKGGIWASYVYGGYCIRVYRRGRGGEASLEEKMHIARKGVRPRDRRWKKGGGGGKGDGWDRGAAASEEGFNKLARLSMEGKTTFVLLRESCI